MSLPPDPRSDRRHRGRAPLREVPPRVLAWRGVVPAGARLLHQPPGHPRAVEPAPRLPSAAVAGRRGLGPVAAPEVRLADVPDRPSDDLLHLLGQVRQLDRRVAGQRVADPRGGRGRAIERPRDLGSRERIVRTDVEGLVAVVVAKSEPHADQQRPEAVGASGSSSRPAGGGRPRPPRGPADRARGRAPGAPRAVVTGSVGKEVSVLTASIHPCATAMLAKRKKRSVVREIVERDGRVHLEGGAERPVRARARTAFGFPDRRA